MLITLGRSLTELVSRGPEGVGEEDACGNPVARHPDEALQSHGGGFLVYYGVHGDGTSKGNGRERGIRLVGYVFENSLDGFSAHESQTLLCLDKVSASARGETL